MRITERCEIFRADAFEWLALRKSESIHAILTDPPFGLVEYSPEQLAKRQNGKGGIWRLPPNFDGANRAPLPRFTALNRDDLCRLKRFHGRLAPLMYQVLVPGGHVIMASQVLVSHLVVGSFVESGFEFRGQIVRIVKTLRGGDRPKGAHQQYPDVSVMPRACWEPWLIFRRPCESPVRECLARWSTGALRRPHPAIPFADLIRVPPAPRRERQVAPHPSLKPQELMRNLVWASLPCGRGVILDPFMGAGATLAAASYYGFRSIGLELHSEYFEMARRAIPLLAQLEIESMPRPVRVARQSPLRIHLSPPPLPMVQQRL